jgi:tripartite-type tricarboxylate transporter receptor subunit TctC
MVVQVPAGGPIDGIARVLAQVLSARLGQKVIIENRAGAGGLLGATTVAKASPDGYTLLMTSTGPLGYYRALYKSLSYDPVKALTPVTLIGTIPQVLVVSPKLPVNTLAEFVAYAKANPGKVNVGDSGVGTTPHILGVLLSNLTGIDIQHVHYRGVGSFLPDVIGGQIEAALSAFVPAYVSMKVLGVTARERVQSLPNVPTFRESGIDIVSGLSITLAVPGNTPQDIIGRLATETNNALKGDLAQVFESKYSLEIAGGTPEDARNFLAAETARLEPVIRKAKITID